MPLTLLKVGGIVTAGEQPNEGPDLRSAIDAGIRAKRLRRAPIEGGGCVYTDDKPITE